MATINGNKVFGERALETDEKRGATVKAHEKTICIVLYKNDFKDIVYHIKMIQKSRRL